MSSCFLLWHLVIYSDCRLWLMDNVDATVSQKDIDTIFGFRCANAERVERPSSSDDGHWLRLALPVNQ